MQRDAINYKTVLNIREAVRKCKMAEIIRQDRLDERARLAQQDRSGEEKEMKSELEEKVIGIDETYLQGKGKKDKPGKSAGQEPLWAMTAVAGEKNSNWVKTAITETRIKELAVPFVLHMAKPRPGVVVHSK